MLTTVVAAVVGVTAAELSEHTAAVAPAATAQLTNSGALNPAIGVTVAVVVVPSPAATLPAVGFRLIVKSTPVPLSVAVSPL